MATMAKNTRHWAWCRKTGRAVRAKTQREILQGETILSALSDQTYRTELNVVPLNSGFHSVT